MNVYQKSKNLSSGSAEHAMKVIDERMVKMQKKIRWYFMTITIEIL